MPYAFAKENDEIEKEFKELQDSITETLQENGNKYIYDEILIRSMVDSFDVDLFNEEYNVNYTNKTLADEMLKDIADFEIPIMTYNTPVYACDRNLEFNEWNYTRYYKSQGKATEFKAALKKDSNGLNVLASLAGVFSIWASAGIGFYSWQRNNMADDIDNYNGVCGIVMDINHYTTQWYTASQEKNPGHF